jgi:hypothetical protein
MEGFSYMAMVIGNDSRNDEKQPRSAKFRKGELIAWH